MLDVANLAWKLAGSVHGWAPPGLLDTYSGDALRALFLELTATSRRRAVSVR